MTIIETFVGKDMSLRISKALYIQELNLVRAKWDPQSCHWLGWGSIFKL